MKKLLAIFVTFAAFFSAICLANNNSSLDGLRGSQDVGETNKIPTIKTMPKEQTRMALNYVNQPPMIPHAVENYQINQANNGCLDCHSVQNYRKTGAVRISPTHYIDRNNKVLPYISPRRYFCMQCHVPQVLDGPIIENTFEPATGFAE